MKSIEVASLLESLEVFPGDLVFIHTSFSRLKHLNLDAVSFIQALISYLGKNGTLVMPAYTWHLNPKERPWVGYKQYFNQRPIFDIKHTKANIGYIPELFRQMEGVHRSLSYWWSICACGLLAYELTQGQEYITSYYGTDSSFGLLHKYGVKIVGLGVTLNTTSLALIPDYHLRDLHIQNVFTPTLKDGVVKNNKGNEIVTKSYWLYPDVVRNIKPSRLFELSPILQNVTQRADYQEVIQFSYPYTVYYNEAMQLGTRALMQDQPVPWLESYSEYKD